MELKQRKFLATIAQRSLPSDIINIIFVSFLLLLTVVFYNRVQNPHFLLVLYGGMLLTVLALLWLVPPEGHWLWRLLRSWYPLAFVILSFFSLGSVVHHILPYDIDAELIALDASIFGGHPTVFISTIMNPYLVDLFTLCYVSFYFLPVILGGLLYWKGKKSEFEAFAFMICLGFYLSDIGNLLFPARGPSQTLVALHIIPLQGKYVGDFIRAVVFVLEPYRWDCFPSGHVTVTVLTLALSYRFERRLFWWLLPIGTGLVFSTVYLRYHYVIDLIAGAMLATSLLIGARIAQRVWARIRQLRQSRVEIPHLFRG